MSENKIPKMPVRASVKSPFHPVLPLLTVSHNLDECPMTLSAVVVASSEAFSLLPPQGVLLVVFQN